MRRLLFLALPAALLAGCSYPPEHPYAVADIPTPVLYTQDFRTAFGGKDGNSLHFDDYGEIDEVEMVALPGTAFTIERDVWKGGKLFYKVTSDDYPYPADDGHYIDSRFVTATDTKPAPRPRSLAGSGTIMSRMLAESGSIYTWGGNYDAGIPELLAYWPPKDAKLTTALRDQWMLKGVDCSGLLYEATNGYTPRNTSSLISYGTGVTIAGLTADEIAAKLRPLDLIAWKGHLIIVLDNGRTIESRLDYDEKTEGNQGGVRVRTVKEVLEQTLEKREAVNNYDDPVAEGKKPFVVRRWYGKT